MKFLKAANKFIEGILFIIVPVIVFYWSLSLVKLDIVKPLIAILGSVIEPFVFPFRPFITYVVDYDNFSVDYTVLFFAGIILCAAFVFTINGFILNFIDEKIEESVIEHKNKERLKQVEEEKQEYIKEVNRNKTIFVILKLIKNKPHASYLIKEDESDFFSGGLVESYENSISTAYLKYGGTSYKNTDDYRYFIFTDLSRFLEYLPFLMNRVEEVNKGMLDLNIRFDYKIACHCAYSDGSADTDFEITSKILNLCDSKEILLSELLKNRLDLRENKNFKLFSRGIYLINDKQMDVFKLQYN